MQEIDFVMSDLSLEIIGDFAIVWLLSPKKRFGAAPTSAMGKLASHLPGHALQVHQAHSMLSFIKCLGMVCDVIDPVATL